MGKEVKLTRIANDHLARFTFTHSPFVVSVFFPLLTRSAFIPRCVVSLRLFATFSTSDRFILPRIFANLWKVFLVVKSPLVTSTFRLIHFRRRGTKRSEKEKDKVIGKNQTMGIALFCMPTYHYEDISTHTQFTIILPSTTYLVSLNIYLLFHLHLAFLPSFLITPIVTFLLCLSVVNSCVLLAGWQAGRSIVAVVVEGFRVALGQHHCSLYPYNPEHKTRSTTIS